MNKKLKELKEKAEKQFGKGSVMLLGDTDLPVTDVIATGIYSLDKALGVGGFPKGRMVEVFGPESGGKTTLALYVVAEAQRRGDIVAFIDAEHSLDLNLAKILGVKTEELFISQPDSGEDALEMVDHLARSGDVGVIVVDSVAALTPRAEIEGEMGDSVSFDTPIYIKHKTKKTIDIVPIEDLYGGKINMVGNQEWYKETKSWEVLTHKGWANLNGVVRKKNKDKKILKVTHTTSGYVKTTEDHSLFKEGWEVSPLELKKFDRVDTVATPIFNNKNSIDKDIAWLLGFWCAEGSSSKLENGTFNRLEVCNTKLPIIQRCQEIVEDKFLTKTKIRQPRSQDKRSQLFVLSSYADSLIGFWMSQCMTKKSYLKKVPVQVLNASKDIKIEFLKGFFEGDGSHSCKSGVENYYNNSLPLMSGIQFLLTSVGKLTSITLNKNRLEQIIVGVKQKLQNAPNEIKGIYDLDSPEFLFDLNTDSGTFVTALGNIVCHNSNMGKHARLMSQACRKLTHVLAQTNTLLVWINQIRHKIGVVYGSPEVTTGGHALKFYSSMRLEVRPGAKIKEGDGKAAKIVGHEMKVKVSKNKLAAPFINTSFPLFYGRGVDTIGDMFDLAVQQDIVTKAGAHYSFEGDKLGHGRTNALEKLASDDALMATIKERLDGPSEA